MPSPASVLRSDDPVASEVLLIGQDDARTLELADLLRFYGANVTVTVDRRTSPRIARAPVDLILDVSPTHPREPEELALLHHDDVRTRWARVVCASWADVQPQASAPFALDRVWSALRGAPGQSELAALRQGALAGVELRPHGPARVLRAMQACPEPIRVRFVDGDVTGSVGMLSGHVLDAWFDHGGAFVLTGLSALAACLELREGRVYVERRAAEAATMLIPLPSALRLALEALEEEVLEDVPTFRFAVGDGRRAIVLEPRRSLVEHVGEEEVVTRITALDERSEIRLRTRAEASLRRPSRGPGLPQVAFVFFAFAALGATVAWAATRWVEARESEPAPAARGPIEAGPPVHALTAIGPPPPVHAPLVVEPSPTPPRPPAPPEDEPVETPSARAQALVHEGHRFMERGNPRRARRRFIRSLRIAPSEAARAGLAAARAAEAGEAPPRERPSAPPPEEPARDESDLPTNPFASDGAS